MKRNHMLMGLLVAAGVLGSSVGLAQSSSGGGSAGTGGYGAGAGAPPESQRGGSQMGGPQTGGSDTRGSQMGGPQTGGSDTRGSQMGGSQRGGAQMGGPSGRVAQPGERATPSATPGGPGASASPYAYAPGQWKKGDRLPAAYRDRQYVIDDWRSFQLERPPKGHQWVGVGNEFLLVSTRNGTIARVVTGQ
ncbi:RcnB family protein [Cupriavidus sp. UGS-1]|uniref:RcnB family protein n=1 Tax=Cupriavidus sp. UGS-1 TaxID=2899826 RepID=UPI00351D32C3